MLFEGQKSIVAQILKGLNVIFAYLSNSQMINTITSVILLISFEQNIWKCGLCVSVLLPVNLYNFQKDFGGYGGGFFLSYFVMWMLTLNCTKSLSELKLCSDVKGQF